VEGEGREPHQASLRATAPLDSLKGSVPRYAPHRIRCKRTPMLDAARRGAAVLHVR